MGKVIARPLGVLLIAGAIFGWIISVAGLIGVWRAESQIESDLRGAITLMQDTLQATSDGLTIINTSLEQTRTQLDVMRTTGEDASKALENTTGMFNNFATLTGKNFKDVVTSTQQSLTAAQASARLVDDTLSFITAIPFIGGRYKPTMPLNTAIQQVSASLDGLPDQLTQVQTGLSQTATNLESIRGDVGRLNANIDEIDKSLTSAQTVVQQYRPVVQRLQDSLDNAHQNLSRWVRLFTMAVSLALVWLIIAQVALITQGIELLNR